jgi:hypothetical protein
MPQVLGGTVFNFSHARPLLLAISHNSLGALFLVVNGLLMTRVSFLPLLYPIVLGFDTAEESPR